MPIERSTLLRQLDVERRTLAHLGEVLEQHGPITRLTSADGSRYTINYSALDAQNAVAAIADEVAHYRDINAAVEWKLHQHDSPADLMQKLDAAGFEIGRCETVLALDLSDQHQWIDETPSHRVERVTTGGQVKLYRQTAELILRKDYQFTSDELMRHLIAGSADHTGYFAYHDDSAVAVPVSIGRLYTHASNQFGGLYGGATLPQYRGTGFYRAITAARARDARASGAKFLIVDAAPASFRILQWLGFVEVTKTWPCTLGPATPK